MTAHWGIHDPAAVEGSDEDKARAFNKAFRELDARLKIFTIALVFFEDRTAQRQWPALAAPVIPAIYVLGYFFTGGFHGMQSVPRYLLVLGIWYVALVIWWILIEVGRMAWRFMRG